MKKLISLLTVAFLTFSSCAGKYAPLSRPADEFVELREVFTSAEPLIEDGADRQKLSAAVETILYLSQAQRTETEYGAVYDDGSRKLSVRHSGGGAFKGAFGHRVKTVFYLKDGSPYINFFLTVDDADLVINIGCGGHKDDDWNQWGAEFDYEPNRFYEFNTKTGSVRTGDFYPE